MNLILDARKKRAVAGQNAVWPEPHQNKPQKTSEKKLQNEKGMGFNSSAQAFNPKERAHPRPPGPAPPLRLVELAPASKPPGNIPPIVNPPRRLIL